MVANMKYCQLIGIMLYLALAALLLAQDKQSTTEQPSPAKSAEKRQDRPSSETKHGPIDILSDTGGVDIHPYLVRALSLIKQSWYSRIPESASDKKGKVTIKFTILKDGEITDVVYVDRTGDAVLDQAAYASITGSNPLPLLPRQFSCKYLALQFNFYYNMDSSLPKDPAGSLIPCVSTKISSVQPIRITVSPTSAEMVVGTKQQFSVTLTGDSNPEVNWTATGSGCSGLACGSISREGLYTAPSSLPSSPKVIVTATLASDPAETTTATVILVPAPTSR
jgi:TonB family protein